MPSLKVQVNPEAKSAFQQYEGPEVPAADGYEGVIKNVRVKVGKESGNPYLNVLVEHDSKDPNKKQYNGAPQWIRVMFGEHDETQARLAAFIKAVTGKANKEANIVDTDEDARAGTGSLVKTIDGVKPDGKRVKFDVRERAASGGYAASTEGDFIRRIVETEVDPGVAEADEVDEEDVEVELEDGEEEAELEVEQTREEREAELKKESLVDLKAAAAAAEIDIKGLKKLEIISAILDWEFEDVAEEEGEEDEEVDEEEDVEVEEEEEEAEEEDEEVEDEEDPEALLRTELAPLDRTALKARLKDSDPEAKVLKKDTDDDLREKIVAAELGEAPF